MPAAYDIYADQLRELRRGQPLYYPEPSEEEGPIEIGDVGYTRQGAFCRLFNVSRSADHPKQTLGVPNGFQPLVMGRILSYEAALEPGPLHSKTIFRVNADVETPGAVLLPASASFRFSCTSSRGAILMLETQMSRHQALHDSRFKNYLLQHCLSWYEFARELGVQVDFGDIMLITECSRTAAWASAVYSQCSREFGLSFSAGGAFLPSAGGLDISAGVERIGPVEHRRSQRRVITLDDLQNVPKHHTVFIRGYRLGSRSLYLRSIARKIMKTTNRSRPGDQLSGRETSPPSQRNNVTMSPTTPTSPFRRAQPTDSSSELWGSMNASAIVPEWPDFHPAVALLAHEMETTNVEFAAVHDDEWCSSYSEGTSRIIDDYAQCFFNENFREQRPHYPNNSILSLLQTDQKSITPSQEIGRFALLRTQGLGDAHTAVFENDRTSVVLNLSAVSFPSPALDLSLVTQAHGLRAGGKEPEGLPFWRQKDVLRETPLTNPIMSSSPKAADRWRFVTLGEGLVGKTALAIQFTRGTFVAYLIYQNHDRPIEDVWTKKLPIDEQDCTLEILDTRLSRKGIEVTRMGDAFILVYSVDSRAAFERIRIIHQDVLRRSRHRPLFVIVGNKADRVDARKVSHEEGERLAESLGCRYVETSAKTAFGVHELFVDLVRRLRRLPPASSGEQAEGSSGITRNRVKKDTEGVHRSCILM